jgi:glycosyltransferase involved in cell wall biosynthesis
VAIGHDMAALFSGLGIKQNRIKVIAVWSSLWVPAPKTSGWKDDRGTRAYSVLYAGHLGPWHDYKTIESVIPNFASGGVLFRFAGVGSGIEHLKAEAAKTRAGNIAFEPRVVSTDIASLVALLSSADAHLITLHSSAIGTCVPSKLYAAMAVARPIIYVGPAESQASLDVQAAGAGFIVAPGDVGGLERAIRKLAADPQESRRLGLQGYQWFRKNRSLDVAIRVWDQLLCELAPSGKHQTAHDSSTLAVRS